MTWCFPIFYFFWILLLVSAGVYFTWDLGGSLNKFPDWCIDFRTPPTPLIILHRLPAFLESLMPLKNSCSIHARWSKSSLKHSIRFRGFFQSLKQSFIAYLSSSRPDCIYEIHQLWQSNCYYSCSFESEIIRISQSSHKMYSNNIQNFQESTAILNACTKKVWKLIEGTTYILI